ncbi:MAG: hypothetical protein WC989_02765 [Micavibrio sp.]
MAVGFAFNKSVGALFSEGPLARQAIEGAREVGLRINDRAPGVVPAVRNEFTVTQP